MSSSDEPEEVKVEKKKPTITTNSGQTKKQLSSEDLETITHAAEVLKGNKQTYQAEAAPQPTKKKKT